MVSMSTTGLSERVVFTQTELGCGTNSVPTSVNGPLPAGFVPKNGPCISVGAGAAVTGSYSAILENSSIFKPQEAKDSEKVPTTFEEKADVYAKGEAEIQKLIEEAKAKEKLNDKYKSPLTIGDGLNIKTTFPENNSSVKLIDSIFGKGDKDTVDEKKIRRDYENEHPVYAQVKDEMLLVEKVHDKNIELKMAVYDLQNLASNDPQDIKDARRSIYKYEQEKKYKEENKDYAYLVDAKERFKNETKNSLSILTSQKIVCF